MLPSKFTVALLLSDFKETQLIHDELKRQNVESHFYDDLTSFWTGIIHKKPSFCIVDIKLIAHNNLLLSDHPLIKEQETSLVLYYADSTAPLLISTHLFDEVNTLKKSNNYQPALERIVEIKKAKYDKRQQYIELKNLFLQKEAEVKKLSQVQTTQAQVTHYQSLVKKTCLDFDKLRYKVDFNNAIEKIFDSINEIESYSILELSFNGQKLISAFSDSAKNHQIPSIWLGKSCTNGIESFAQNMATQVAMEQMPGNLVSLLIRGKKNEVTKMIFIKSSQETFYNHYDWDVLESYLNGFIATSENLDTSNDVMDTRRLSGPFEAMSYIDQYLFGQSAHDSKVSKLDPNLKLVSVDLTELIERVLKQKTNRFYWNRFLTDFVNKFEIQSGYSFKYFEYGVNQISFLVAQNQFQNFYDQLREYASNFSYWKYFENSDGILAAIIEPKVFMIPLSAYAYISKVSESNSNVVQENIGPEKKIDIASEWTFVHPKSTLDI